MLSTDTLKIQYTFLWTYCLMFCSVVYIIYFGFGCDICIRVTSVRIIIITHSDRALFDLNALVSSLGGIVPSAYGLGHYSPLGLHSGI